MLFYYIRHGDPTYRPDSLTPLGFRQAEAVGKRLSTHGLDKIFASDSTRAMQTAQPACEILKKDKVILPWCNENIAWNEITVLNEDGEKRWAFDNRPTTELFRSKEIRELGDKFYTHPAFKDEKTYGITKFCEGLARIQTNADELFASLGYRHDKERNGYIAEAPTNERVALFAHQGFGLAFLSCVLDIPYPTFCTSFDLSHSSMTVIEFNGKQGSLCYPKILQLANDSHLYHEGMGTKYNNRIYI